MTYERVRAKTHSEARAKALQKFGMSARIIKSREEKEGGFLGIGRKKIVELLISVPDDYQLDKYKRDLNIPIYEKEKTEVKKTIIPNVVEEKKEDKLDTVLTKLMELENNIKNGSNGKSGSSHQNLDELKDILKENEFSDDFVDEFIKLTEKTLPLSKIENRIDLHDFAYKYIANKLKKISRNGLSIDQSKKNVYVLVGPTGVGKTTTVTKMAALALQGEKKPELITIDGFRIGAKYQLEKYAEIMQLKISSAESSLDLERIVTLSDSSFILVDTIGRSQSDEIELAKMKSILKLKSIEAHFILAVSATTKPREIKKIFKNFDLFDYEGVIVTKNDESRVIGSILGEAILRDKGIVYVTTGQKVPDHIEEATVETLMHRIEGLEPTVYLTNASY